MLPAFTSGRTPFCREALEQAALGMVNNTLGILRLIIIGEPRTRDN